MKKSFSLFYVLFLAVFFNASCGHDQSETTSQTSDENPQTTETISATGDKNTTDNFDVTLVDAVIKCEGMTCTGCEGTVEKSVLALNGVKEVKADHINKTVTVKYSKDEVTQEKLENAITEVGYEVVRN